VDRRLAKLAESFVKLERTLKAAGQEQILEEAIKAADAKYPKLAEKRRAAHFLAGETPRQRSFKFEIDNARRIQSASTASEMLAIFNDHPEWRKLPQPVLKELSLRTADRSRRWEVYDCDHAFELLLFISAKRNKVATNFTKICGNTGGSESLRTPEAKLHLFAHALYNQASLLVQEAPKALTGEALSVALEDAKACAEASLICDRYYLFSFLPAAMAWVQRNGDLDKALKILAEGLLWAERMATECVHSVSIFDEGLLSGSGRTEIVQALQSAMAEVEENKRMLSEGHG